ncbi:hypothetical protein DFH27DRAFT_550337 [Peziza echinospora]|nr:hypothetical protein DFH27DRAFT_550337 [Peziza echinospora]
MSHNLGLPQLLGYPPSISEPIDLEKPLESTTGSIEGKTILITGGASGIGYASASHLYKLGGYIVLGDINEEKGLQAAKEIEAEDGGKGKGKIVFFKCDISSYESQANWFLFALEWSPTKQINCVFINAAAPEVGVLLEDVDFVPGQPPPPPNLTTFNTNFAGTFYTIRLAHHYLRHNGDGDGKNAPDRHILLMGSFASFLSSPFVPLYSSAKHGLLGLFASIRVTSLGYDRVRINLISPYFVKTPFMPASVRLLLAGQAMISMDEMALCVVRMVGDESIRGRMLAVGPEGWQEDVEVGGEAEEWETFGRRAVGALNAKWKAQTLWSRWGSVAGDVVRILAGMTAVGVAAKVGGWRAAPPK